MNIAVPLFYLAAAVGVALVVTGLVRSRRGSGGPLHDRYEAAFLNGGPARVADTALAALQADGRLAVGGPGIVSVLRPLAYDPVERAVLQAHAEAPHGALHQLRLAVMRHPAVQEIGDGLAARGLLVAPAVRRSVLRRCAVVGFGTLPLFPVAFVLTVMDFVAGDPSFPFVLKVAPALIAAVLAAVVCGALGAGQVTPAGRRAVSAYGRDHARPGDAGHLVALYGLGALRDPVVRELFVAAARFYGPVGRRGRGGRSRTSAGDASWAGGGVGAATVWCAGTSSCGGGNSCSGGGGSCSSGACSGGGSGCGGGSGSSCGGSGSSSSCGSSSSSSCGG
ncbi:TIGR04222 domain-containing membrane protein [Streptomyces sp. NPDC059247]|uniref:TIGR04222 domain-containing membrane protein n=1 Tax=Streptomyces sp. NPDC059247 TaxID=3346790 RepID=UPI0036879506